MHQKAKSTIISECIVHIRLFSGVRTWGGGGGWWGGGVGRDSEESYMILVTAQ